MSREMFRGQCAAEVAARRLALGLSQENVAEALHVDRTLVTRWERSERGIDEYDWRMLQRFFADEEAKRPRLALLEVAHGA